MRKKAPQPTTTPGMPNTICTPCGYTWRSRGLGTPARCPRCEGKHSLRRLTKAEQTAILKEASAA
jgi:predicted Zn-ribbon and HTH transcriptional regulator